MSLARDGFTIVADALAPADLDALRSLFPVAAADRGTEHIEIAGWSRLADHPALRAAAEEILARPFRLASLHGRNPLPGYGQQGLHADWPPRTPGDPFAIVTSIWMLDAFTGDNGATRLVPGTHLSPRPIPKSLAQPEAHHPDEVLATAPAGSLLIFNGHLWHSGTRNRSQGPRRAVQLQLIGSELRYG